MREQHTSIALEDFFRVVNVLNTRSESEMKEGLWIASADVWNFEAVPVRNRRTEIYQL